MGAGFHSMNGLKQCVNGKLWSTYVIPRLLYGLEVLDLKQSDLQRLESYQKKSLKQIQHLPDRAPNSASLALMGILPIEAVVHKNMLNLFWRWLTSEGIEYDICLRQLAVKSPDEKSWFNRIRDLLYRYDLPSPSVLLEQPLSKSKWKSMIDKAIHAEVEGTWREDIQLKSSLKYINPNKVKVGQCHPVWDTVRDNVYDSRRAQTKCRLLTGTYTLQSNKAVFNQHAVDPTCKLCRGAPETRQHFLVECQALQKEREKYLRLIEPIADRLHIDLSSPDAVTRLILDPSVYTESVLDITNLEIQSRELIDILHRKRLRLLTLPEEQQGPVASILICPDSELVPAAHTVHTQNTTSIPTVRRQVNGGNLL